MKKKQYNGYKSFQYLEPNKDYKAFKLAKEIDRVPSRNIELSKSEEERVEEILEKYVVISLHDHSTVFPENPQEILPYVREGRMFTGYEGLAISGIDVIFDGLFDGLGLAPSRDPWSWDNVVYQIGMFTSDIDHQNLAFIVRRVEDVEKAHREGKIGVVIHMEGTPRIGEEIDRVDVLYGLGVRCMGITYSKGNEFGSGLADKYDKGLTDLGYKLVERMNKIGIAIDIAHSSDKTSMDVIEASKKPVFITHAGARKLWPTRRMKPDEVIQALAENGGVIGVEASPHTTLTLEDRRHSIETVMKHFQYIEKLVGIDYVAFGPDTLFGDHVALHKVFTRELSLTETRTKELEYQEVEYVDGLENPSQFKNIVRWLVKNGYSDEEIGKVIGGNVLRVLREVW
ncbi:MAG: dipeptidase [archaeon YNP-LCB-024-027]|jgi:membrane dipeptidase|nr:dipeptidase [Candidatus Culexarchaeum yellowstonense]